MVFKEWCLDEQHYVNMKKTYFINLVRMLYLCIEHVWKGHKKMGKSDVVTEE